MRLFIAITFRAELRRFLAGLGEAAAAAGVKGRFSPEENLHLTLALSGRARGGRSWWGSWRIFAVPPFLWR